MDSYQRYFCCKKQPQRAAAMRESFTNFLISYCGTCGDAMDNTDAVAARAERVMDDTDWMLRNQRSTTGSTSNYVL